MGFHDHIGEEFGNKGIRIPLKIFCHVSFPNKRRDK
jgi:hypothetical protein